jgi:hypothetical protein
MKTAFVATMMVLGLAVHAQAATVKLFTPLVPTTHPLVCAITNVDTASTGGVGVVR